MVTVLRVLTSLQLKVQSAAVSAQRLKVQSAVVSAQKVRNAVASAKKEHAAKIRHAALKQSVQKLNALIALQRQVRLLLQSNELQDIMD